MVTSALGKTFRSDNLSSFFEPESVAVIASLKEDWMGGYVVIKSLLNAGYMGSVFPVNSGYKEVLGLPAYSSIKDIHAHIELAIIMINARGVPNIIRECGEKGIKSVIVVSDGFAERDGEGARLQGEIVKIARQWGISLIGPNTVGVLNSRNGFNPCPYDAGYYKLRPGVISICSQTGMTSPQAFPYPSLRFGISKICDLGNKCDLDECDVLEFLERDPTTNVISMYLENVRDGQKFLEVARRVVARKPLLILKSGRTGEGAQASASHTGSLAIDDQIFDTVCQQAGILRLGGFSELFELPKIFASQPLPRGNRLGIITQSGAFGVLAVDEGARYGLTVAALSRKTLDMLAGIFPGLGQVPVDLGPAASLTKNFFSLYPKILDTVMADENVDSLLSNLWTDSSGRLMEHYIKAYEEVRGRYEKPLVTWVFGSNASVITELTQELEEMGFPVFSSLNRSIKALGLAFKYASINRQAQGDTP